MAIIDIAYAAPSGEALVSRFIDAVVNPVIVILFAVAFLYFLWGVFLFIKNSDNDTGRTTGKRHITWGLVGLIIMVGAAAIVQVISRFVGN